MSHFEEGRNYFISNIINNNSNNNLKLIKEINNNININISNINKIIYFINPITEIIFQSLINSSSSSSLTSKSNSETLNIENINLSEINNNNNNNNRIEDWLLIGNIYLQNDSNNSNNNSNKKQIISEIYINKSNNIVMIKNINNISDNLVYDWINLVSFENVQEIMIFDGIHVSKFNHNHHDRLRVLFSSHVSDEDKEIYNGIKTLETGNIVENVSAALICNSELNSLKAILCLAIRESSYSQEAAQAYLQLENQLKNFLEIDHIQFIDSKIHKKMMKHDPFVSRTSNMFI